MSNVELVVKIPKIEYEHLTNQEKFDSLTKNKQEWLINKILNRVIDGTSLPKGHGRLIDEERISLSGIHFEAEIDHAMMIGRLNSAPTIIEADKEQEDGND